MSDTFLHVLTQLLSKLFRHRRLRDATDGLVIQRKPPPRSFCHVIVDVIWQKELRNLNCNRHIITARTEPFSFLVIVFR